MVRLNHPTIEVVFRVTEHWTAAVLTQRAIDEVVSKACAGALMFASIFFH